MKLSKHCSRSLFAALSLGVAGLGLAATPLHAQDLPAAIQALEKQGLTVTGKMPAASGLTAYAGYMGQQPVALYVMPDGKSVVAGTLFDAEGRDVTRDNLLAAVRKPMSDRDWQNLTRSTWIADGLDSAPRKIYVFMDANCPYCNKFWADARPWVDSGKVQLRHVVVALLAPSSLTKAATLLGSKDPAATLHSYEQAHVTPNAKALAAGQPKLLDDSGLKPTEKVPADVRAKLEANVKLMASMGLQGVPAIVWRDANGVVQMHQGLLDAKMAEVMGPR